MQGPLRLLFISNGGHLMCLSPCGFGYTIVVLCTQCSSVCFASSILAMVVFGCVYSRVGLIALLLDYEYPVQGLFC